MSQQKPISRPDGTIDTRHLAVTVLFATHNGGEKLRRMLTAMVGQLPSRARWKLVAVDNASTDDTARILDRFRDRLPLTVLTERRAGKGVALDTGFAHVEGDLLILTDDDVLPAAGWVDSFVALAAAHPDRDMFSGLIEPEWDAPPPDWVLDWAPLSPLYAVNTALPEGPMQGRHIFGPNSCFRTRILPDRYTVEGASVGPDSGRALYAMGGDTAFAMALEAQGHLAWHSRAPRLRHIIPARYLTEEWVLGRAERFGRGSVHFYPNRFRSRLRIGPVPLRLLLRHLSCAVAGVVMRPLPMSRARMAVLWQHRFSKGAIAEIRARGGSG